MIRRLFAILAVFGAVLLSIVHTDSLSAFQAGETQLSLPSGQQFTNAGRQVVAISPDGRYVLYVANQTLYLKSGDQAQPVAIPGLESVGNTANPFFSPDSKSIAFWSGDQTIKRIPREGGTVVTIARGGNPFGASWGPNDQIVMGQRAGIVRVSAAGGTPEMIVSVGANEVPHGPQVLPGGDAVLFTLATVPTTGATADMWDKAKIVVQSLRSTDRKTLIEGGSDARYTPSGHLVYAVGDKIYAVRFDASRLEVAGSPVVVVEGVRRSGAPTGTAQFAFSDTGTLVFSPAVPPGHRLVTVDLDGTMKTVGSVPTTVIGPRLSPDEKQITFDAVDSQTQTRSIFVYDLPTQRLRNLAAAGNNRFSAWSPDGKHILYIAVPEAESSLKWRLADGTGTPEVLLETARAPESWSATNRFMSFITLKSGTNTADYDIWTYSFETRKATPLIEIPPSGQHSSKFSADGRWVAYASDETGQYEIYVQPYPITGARFQITKTGGGHPLWSHDGKQLYFNRSGRLFAVDIRTQPEFSAGEPRALPISGFLQAAGNNRRQYELTAGGQFLMVFPYLDELRIRERWFDDLKRLRP